MLDQKRTLVLSMLMATFALSACQPKADQKEQKQPVEQSSSSEAVDTTLTLQGQSEKVAVELPECSGNSCPEFSVERLHTNQFVVDNIIDQAILKNLDQILDVGNQSKSIQEEKKKTEQQQKQDEQQASSSVIAANAAKTPAQSMADQLKPYVATFTALQQELLSLGASSKISVSVSPKILNSTEPLATVVLNTSSYLGGAHGSASQVYYNFDLKHQKQVGLDDIIVPNQKKELEKLAYEAFKAWVTDNKLADNLQEYEQVWKFKLSNNFYLGKNGLILQYGEYEIGPYVVGLPRLEIPYSALKTVLKQPYLPAELLVDQPASATLAAKNK
ncbi:RsiV family protein [Acinetobacter defluvii]|uniref:RsiV family protein n=1 Tax=Acinetobacter defluvii TaxID=1871111 RepID=UPI003AF8340D